MSENYLIHIGTKNSGRYPRGSGERPHQHDGLSPTKRWQIDYKNKRRKALDARKKYKQNPTTNTYNNYKNARKDWFDLNLYRLIKQEHRDAKNNYKNLKEKYKGKELSKNMKIKLKEAKHFYKKTYSRGKSVALGLLVSPAAMLLYDNIKQRQTINRMYGD